MFDFKTWSPKPYVNRCCGRCLFMSKYHGGKNLEMVCWKGSEPADMELITDEEYKKSKILRMEYGRECACFIPIFEVRKNCREVLKEQGKM
jgi:hypothetical protein